MEYRCVATSVEGFVQQLAVAYVTHGYWFYVTGEIPEHKDPAAVDRKLVERYGIAISKWARARRKRRGLANMQYLRHEQTFVLLATKGQHEFFEQEHASIRDIRRVPITFVDYSIGCRKGCNGHWHASVRIHPVEYKLLKDHFLELASHREITDLTRELQRVPFEPYAPVRRQLLNVLRAVNRMRQRAGFEAVPWTCLRLRRGPRIPFAQDAVSIPETQLKDGSRVLEARAEHRSCSRKYFVPAYERAQPFRCS